MFQKHLAITSLLLIVGIVILHTAANTFYWYVSIPWYDMMMHTLGGVFLAVFTAAFLNRYILTLSQSGLITLLLLIVLLVGLEWEFFEYTVQYLVKGSARLASIPDSVSDIICDMAGGALGVYFVLNQKKRYNTKNE